MFNIRYGSSQIGVHLASLTITTISSWRRTLHFVIIFRIAIVIAIAAIVRWVGIGACIIKCGIWIISVRILIVSVIGAAETVNKNEVIMNKISTQCEVLLCQIGCKYYTYRTIRLDHHIDQLVDNTNSDHDHHMCVANYNLVYYNSNRYNFGHNNIWKESFATKKRNEIAQIIIQIHWMHVDWRRKKTAANYQDEIQHFLPVYENKNSKRRNSKWQMVVASEFVHALMCAECCNFTISNALLASDSLIALY